MWGWCPAEQRLPAASTPDDSYIRRLRCAETELWRRHTRAVPEASDYVARARTRILDLLDEHLAVVHPELEARIAEGYFRKSPQNIDPHHVTTALRELFDAGQIMAQSERTRGGREVVTMTLSDVGRRKTATAKAISRKRLLMARYQGWSQGTKRDPHGVIGPAGEAAVRGAIVASGALQPAAPGAGEVARLLGVTLPGPLDSAGYMVPLLDGQPQPAITLLFEVKNLRSWIYPGSAELYQLLRKGVLLQTANPTARLAPVLVCRRAHPTLFWMAKQLGFLVFDLEHQFCGDVSPEALNEVRNELFFADLRAGTGPSLRVQDRLTSPGVVKAIPGTAAAWNSTALHPPSADLITTIARTKSAPPRFNLVDALRSHSERELGHEGGW